MAEIRTPGFWEYFFIGEHWKRFTVTGWAGDKYGTAHATQRGAIWLYAVAAAMPWPALLPFLWFGRKKSVAHRLAQSPQRQLTLYLLAWSAAPCLFFTMSGNILWTYVLPALPAMALLAARWLAGDSRTRLVHGVVGAGVISMAVLVAAFFLREQVNDSWKSAKTVVQVQQTSQPGQSLFFMGDLPYSASFYSLGKAKKVADNPELLKLLDQGSILIALKPGQIQDLPPELKSRLKLLASSGAFRLYSSTKP
jgi:hypothetical protein